MTTILDLQPLLADALQLTNEAELRKIIRATRNNLLQECDWTQLPDSPLTEAKRTEWATYRQALRDILETNSTNLAETVFPTVPEV